MTIIAILGREFDVAPYKLGAMRVAAPLIDRVNATAGSLSTLEGLTASMQDIASVVSIGLVKLDPTLTPEYLVDQLGLDDMPALQRAFGDIIRDAGLAITMQDPQSPAPIEPADAALAA